MNNLAQRFDRAIATLVEHLHEDAVKQGTTVAAVEKVTDDVVENNRLIRNFKVTWADGSIHGARVKVDNDGAIPVVVPEPIELADMRRTGGYDYAANVTFDINGTKHVAIHYYSKTYIRRDGKDIPVWSIRRRSDSSFEATANTLGIMVDWSKVDSFYKEWAETQRQLAEAGEQKIREDKWSTRWTLAVLNAVDRHPLHAFCSDSNAMLIAKESTDKETWMDKGYGFGVFLKYKGIHRGISMSNGSFTMSDIEGRDRHYRRVDNMISKFLAFVTDEVNKRQARANGEANYDRIFAQVKTMFPDREVSKWMGGNRYQFAVRYKVGYGRFYFEAFGADETDETKFRIAGQDVTINGASLQSIFNILVNFVA